jgi:anaerobic magnesium-protoporphyrin IX monomethyl ester cyclase
MKVALLYPEVYDMARFKDMRKEFPPFGVLYLAAVAEQAGPTRSTRRCWPRWPRQDVSRSSTAWNPAANRC